VVGPVPAALRVAAALLRRPGCGVRPVGVVADTSGPLPDPGGGPALPVLTTSEEAHRALIQNGVRTVLVVGHATRVRKTSLLREFAAFGCVLWEIDADSPSYDLPGHRTGAGHLAGFSRRLLCPAAGRRHDSVGKRLLDVVLSGSLLLLVSPVLL